MQGISALDLWKAECNLGSIITLSKALDLAIGNGISTNIITEFCGPPGSGKTQICLQLCVNVQIPTSMGGLGGSSIFIDTNHGFSTDRLKDLATASAKHCQNISQRNLSQHNTPEITEKDIFDNVLCTFVSDYIQLLATVEHLKEVLRNNPKVRLIIIDSFSFLFRHGIETLDRVRILYQLLADLEALAIEHKCAVVITNELTTRLTGSTKEEGSVLVPALGDSHSHRVTQQIMLGRDITASDSDRYLARIRKSLYRPESTVPFRITKDGIGDV